MQHRLELLEEQVTGELLHGQPVRGVPGLFQPRFVTQAPGQFGATGPVAGVPLEQILALGAEDYTGGDPTVFNMAVMGFRLAQRANGVSRLHGHVSREMFHGLWPAFDEAEVPITSITNGVHAPTWVGREVFDLAERHGADGDADGVDSFWGAVDHTPSGEISKPDIVCDP